MAVWKVKLMIDTLIYSRPVALAFILYECPTYKTVIYCDWYKQGYRQYTGVHLLASLVGNWSKRQFGIAVQMVTWGLGFYHLLYGLCWCYIVFFIGDWLYVIRNADCNEMCLLAI